MSPVLMMSPILSMSGGGSHDLDMPRLRSSC
jgi:hypothetical protein